jgi:Ca2+-binding RTX toxin-like protein
LQDLIVEAVGGGSDAVIALRADFSLVPWLEIETLQSGSDGNFSGTGNERANTLLGGYDDDLLSGAGGSDRLKGDAGHDTLDGGTGADTLDGGAGDDVYIVDNAGDRIIELANAGTDSVRTTLATFSLVNLVDTDHLVYTGDKVFTGTGNALANQLSGGSGNDILTGLGEADTLWGGAGNDKLLGGDGNDTFRQETGNDTIDGGAGTDRIYLAQTVADYRFERPIPTLVKLTGPEGRVLFLSNIEEIVFEQIPRAVRLLDGTDLLSMIGSTGKDTLTGGADNDTLDGGAGDDVLDGKVGSDVLFGGLGNDSLDGGQGGDLLKGGAGNDTYVIDSDFDTVDERIDTGPNTGKDAGGIDTVKTDLHSYTLSPALAIASGYLGNIEKLEYTGTSTDFGFTGTGNALANTITGGTGNDTLDGGLGADKLIGGAGNDTYLIDKATIVLADGSVIAGDSVVELAGEGMDTLQTTLAAYSIARLVNVENLTYNSTSNFTGTGNTLNNTLTGGIGNDKLYGALGDDTFIATAGNDLFDGGGGADTLDLTPLDLLFAKKDKEGGFSLNKVDATTVTMTIGTQVLTIKGAWGAATGDKGIETFKFDDNAAVTLAQLLDGVMSFGPDPYEDMEGINDNKKAGLGNDTLLGAVGNDSLDGEGGNDSLDGGVGNDTLTGGLGNDILIGGTGSDSLTGGLGDDVYYVDADGDVVSESLAQGSDTVRTTLAGYNLADKAANVEKLIYSGTANFTGSGNALANTITGNIGNDTLDGGQSDGKADILNGGAGDDTYKVGAGDTVIDLEGGTDIVLMQGSLAAWTLGATLENLTNEGSAATFTGNGNALANTLTGGSNVDILNGLGDRDTLLGNAGYDSLNGGAGNDTLTGGEGADKLTGGLDNDTFVFNTDPASGKDTIADFAIGDTLQLDNAIFTALAEGVLSAESFVLGTVAADANDFLLYDKSTGTLWYDADGNGAGAAIEIAVLANKAAIDFSVFQIV